MVHAQRESIVGIYAGYRTRQGEFDYEEPDEPLVILTYRDPKDNPHDRNGNPIDHKWKAAWSCPDCDHEVVEYFAEYPADNQVEQIENDPACVNCRGKGEQP